MSTVSIKNLTRRSIAQRAVFSSIANEILHNWDISLVFVSPARARALNFKLRKKTYTPNVLSYELGPHSGEIIICPREAEKQAPLFCLEPSAYCLYLFIHGLLHLKGWAHGDTMERCEKKLLLKFNKNIAFPLLHETTHRHRHRHRHVPSKNGRRRGAL